MSSFMHQDIQVGDTIAYRVLEPDEPEWRCFTVRAMDGIFYYEHADKTGDNIAIGSAFKVNIPPEQKIKPCPYCRADVVVSVHDDPSESPYDVGKRFSCHCEHFFACSYQSGKYRSAAEAIHHHNQLYEALEQYRNSQAPAPITTDTLSHTSDNGQKT